MNVVPGTQLVHVVSAYSATTSEKILRYMAENTENRNYRRESGEWLEATAGFKKFDFAMVTVHFVSGEKRTVKLQILEEGMKPAGILLRDAPGKKFSLGVIEEKGLFVQLVPRDLSPSRFRETASHILMMCLRGRGWTDRAGKVHKDPCGRDFAAAGVNK